MIKTHSKLKMLLGVLTLLVFILGFSGCQNGNEKTPETLIEKDASSMDLGLDYKKYIDVKPINSAYYDVDYEEVAERFFASYVFENTDIIKNQEN